MCVEREEGKNKREGEWWNRTSIWMRGGRGLGSEARAHGYMACPGRAESYTIR